MKRAAVDIAGVVLSFVLAFPGLALAMGNTCTWTGSWSPQAPVAGDDIVIQSGNLTWNNALPASVGSWTQQAGYSGTLTFGTLFGATGFTNFTIAGDATVLGGTWTHQANSGGETNRLSITIGGNFVVSNATITADALGYSLQKGPGWGTGAGNAYDGGGYGGLGGDSKEGIVSSTTYGSIPAPTNLGSGGYGSTGGGAILLAVGGTTTVTNGGFITANGGSQGSGGGSGGSILLTTARLAGNGTLRANGGAGTSDGKGGGGRIAVILTDPSATFAGWTGTNTAYGAGAAGNALSGAAGTVYLKDGSGYDTLLIDNNGITGAGGVATLMPNGVNLNAISNIVINHSGILGVKGDTTLDFGAWHPTANGAANSYVEIFSDTNVTYPADWLIVGYTVLGEGISKTLTSITIGNAGALGHAANSFATAGERYKLNLTLTGDLTIRSNASINADNGGYAAGYGVTVLSQYDGAGYGGLGGDGSGDGLLSSTIYGSLTAPTNIGSGANAPGAGAVILNVAGTTSISNGGAISASAPASGTGAGSGGSIYLRTGQLVGAGSIRANGGAGGGNRAGGGGGRVAVILNGYGADFGNWSGSLTAFGGYGSGGSRFLHGAAGTVYQKTAAGYDTLTVDDNGNLAYNQCVTRMPDAVNLTAISNIVIRNKGVLGIKGDTTLDFGSSNVTGSGAADAYIDILSDTNVTYPANWTLSGYTVWGEGISKALNSVTINTNGGMGHSGNYSTEKYKLALTLTGNLLILSNGTITADMVGYKDATGIGPGTGNYDGGGYGGLGGAGNGEATPSSKTYGWILSPTNCGSGGAAAPGGGAILLNVAGTTTITNGGSITAAGDGFLGNGAGAGGTVSLITGQLNGNGAISANGGTETGTKNRGAGGGGRVAVILTNGLLSAWNGAIVALGGTSPGSTYYGAAGTVYLQDVSTGPGHGSVIVSNNVSTPLAVETPLPPDVNPGENLNGTVWTVAGQGKLRVSTNVPSIQIGYLVVTGASARVDLQGRILSVLPNLNINGALYGVGAYATNNLAGTNVFDSIGGGAIVVRPVVDNANGATAVTQTGASLNGNLYAGDASSALCVLWGIQDAGTNVAQWAHTNSWAAPLAAGLFSANVTAPDLLPNAVQYYRFYTTNGSAQNIASTSSAFMTADVTVQNTGDASEQGLTPGSFTLYRDPAATNGAITVSYTIGGTARSGTNYVGNLGSNVTFAAGVSQTNLVVTPLQDQTTSNATTIVLTLAAGPYHQGSPSVATVQVTKISMPGAPTNVWVGSGNASAATNWSLGHVPADTETVYLGGYSQANMTWDSTNAIATWLQSPQYTGTVTMGTYYPGQGVFTNLHILGDCDLEGGLWTHTANAAAEVRRLCVTIDGNLSLGSNMIVNADGCGYSAGNGPGKGVGGYDGAGYGGLGGDGGVDGIVNSVIYGSLASPTNLGSGGDNGGAGGGAVVLDVAGTTTLAAGAVVTANGTVYLGGGSGGTVFLRTGQFLGAGAIRANGGAGGGGRAGGGGGRLAVILTTPGADFSGWSGGLAAYGGVGANGRYTHGAAGTVYQKTAAGFDTLTIDNNNVLAQNQVVTLMPDAVNLNSISNVVINHAGILGVKADTVLDLNAARLTVYGATNSLIDLVNDASVTYPANWTISGYTVLGEGISKTLTDLTVSTNGVLTHAASVTTQNHRLKVTLAGNLLVTSNGAVHADGAGLMAVQGPGAGTGNWDGGGYGGLGAAGNGQATVSSATYGQIAAPTNMGSGGQGSAGGGAVILTVAGTTTLTSGGALSANGANEGLGAGSGGSVFLTTAQLAGTGTIRANGGDQTGSNNRGAGGGGRVAVVLTGGDFGGWGGVISAYAGTAPYNAAAGTVFKQAGGSSLGTVLVDNNNTATNVPFTSLPAFTSSLENLLKTQWTLQNRGRAALVATNASIASLSIGNNAYLELAGNTLNVTALTITNTVYKYGVYTASQLGVLVSDSSGGNGRVILIPAAHGTVFVVQ